MNKQEISKDYIKRAKEAKKISDVNLIIKEIKERKDLDQKSKENIINAVEHIAEKKSREDFLKEAKDTPKKLTPKAKEKIKQLVEETNKIIEDAKKENDGDYVGFVQPGGTWEEPEHYTSVVFDEKKESLTFNYYEQTNPNKKQITVFKGHDEYDDERLEKGIAFAKSIQKKINKQLAKDKANNKKEIHEAKITKLKKLINLVEHATNKKVTLRNRK